MKFKRWTYLMLVVALLVCGAAHAEAGLSARIEGDTLKVAWSTAGAGECTLTLSVDGWPMEVLRVQPSGSLERRVDASKDYSVRLKTAHGCLTAQATDVRPTAEPTPVPTVAPTAEPTPVPTAVPTVAPTPVLTAMPMPVHTAKPTAAPTVKPATGDPRGDLAAQVVEQVNQERAKAGLGTLRVDSELTRAAQVRAREIVQSFSHTRPDGTSWSTVSGSAYGENIAMGQKTADKVMAAWMTSQGHRENILRPGFGSIGVCAYISGGVTYWVQLFGK